MKSKIANARALYNLTLILLLCAVGRVPAANATCSIPSGAPVPPSVWEAHMTEIANMGELQLADFQIGNQKIYRKRKHEERRTRDRMLEHLQTIAPKIKALQGYFDTPPDRPVLLIESELNLMGDALAFTSCAARGEKHRISNYGEADGDLAVKLPKGLCLIIMRPHTIPGERLTRFVLAHEWMHTMQRSAYNHAMRESWWVEGSAEWAAHKIVSGVTERANRIEQFFSRQRNCALTQHSYDAQTFFFWGDQVFDTSWGISLGMGGSDYLREPERAAEILPPERWLDWAIAQADRTITMPDGRPLPHQAAFEPLELSDSCGSQIEGPPLSVQLRELRLPFGATGPIKIKAGHAQLAYLTTEGNWQRLTGTTVLTSPPSPLMLTAIMPSGEDLNITLSLLDESGTSCACHVGQWRELPTADSEAEDTFDGALEAIEKFRGMVPPDQLENLMKAKQMIESADTKDRFRFRGATKQIFEMDGGQVTYDYAGPVITFSADGKFQIDDPHEIKGEKTRVDYRRYVHTGRWETEGEVIKIDIQKIDFVGTVSGPTSEGPQDIAGNNDNASYVGGGGDWIASCHDDGLTLIPADERRRGPGKDAVLTPYR